jgi:hypothetical protein
MAKRKKRIWTKRVKYDVRKNFADSRLRVKGRFVKKEDEELLRTLSQIQLEGPSSWGAAFWTPIHLWSILRVPMFPTPEERVELTEIMQRFWPSVIPCTQCASHLKNNSANIFEDTKSALKMFKRLVDMHNWVNVNKKGFQPKSYREVAESFQHPARVCEGIKGALEKTAAISPSDLNYFASGPVTSTALVGSLTVLVISLLVGYICKLRRALSLQKKKHE